MAGTKAIARGRYLQGEQDRIERKEPPGRTGFIGFANRAFAIGSNTGLLDRPVLDRDALIEGAARATGLDDFGGDWFLQPLDRLLDALQSQARLNTAGRFTAYKQVDKVLKDRLLAQQWFARHPEILSRPLPRPVVIVGPMRSGTTRMHRLLACDARFSYLRAFETISPVPPPGFVPGDDAATDPRARLARRIQLLARLANPRTLNIHPTGPFEPEEELGLLVNSFWGMKHEAQWQVPAYGRWCEDEDARPAYFQMARLLRLVGWSQQQSSLRPWILKTPQHMIDIRALLATFPDARVIFTHRDPLALVGSAASLAWNQTIIYSDDVDPNVLGREWLRKTRLQIDRMRSARGSLPEDRQIDVHYAEMDRDWEGAMRRVYRFLGLEIGPALPAMRAYVERSRRLKRHLHRYDLAEFGLDPHRVLDTLADYVEAFDISIERPSGDQRRA